MPGISRKGAKEQSRKDARNFTQSRKGSKPQRCQEFHAKALRSKAAKMPGISRKGAKGQSRKEAWNKTENALFFI
jgi:hypothetical protein